LKRVFKPFQNAHRLFQMCFSWPDSCDMHSNVFWYNILVQTDHPGRNSKSDTSNAAWGWENTIFWMPLIVMLSSCWFSSWLLLLGVMLWCWGGSEFVHPWYVVLARIGEGWLCVGGKLCGGFSLAVLLISLVTVGRLSSTRNDPRISTWHTMHAPPTWNVLGIRKKRRGGKSYSKGM